MQNEHQEDFKKSSLGSIRLGMQSLVYSHASSLAKVSKGASFRSLAQHNAWHAQLCMMPCCH
jgi:hypothetical protein